jgi:hypothetical protein
MAGALFRDAALHSDGGILTGTIITIVLLYKLGTFQGSVIRCEGSWSRV